ncbi:MAG: hypothetical protein MZW92_15825 [Comamonadaceae bacterium]|nr:hypothetical protein [Comamonadaceae bacterium]
MKLPAGARAGQTLRLRGRGLPGHPPGDQFVLLKIVLPPDSPRRAATLRADEARGALRPARGPRPVRRPHEHASTSHPRRPDARRVDLARTRRVLRVACASSVTGSSNWWRLACSSRAVASPDGLSRSRRARCARALATTRLVDDLGVNLAGVALILDLLEERQSRLLGAASRR